MELVTQYLLPCVWAFFACAGFAIIFNIRDWGIVICCAGGALGWFVYLLLGSDIPAAFYASAVIGVYGEVAARLRRCPVTGYVLVALLPLVPGGGIYHAMRHALAHELEQFQLTMIETIGMAIALAVGSMISSSAFRAVLGYVKKLRLRRGSEV
jgi:uncharacterized membrane protein YjjB (DUF3815 family)